MKRHWCEGCGGEVPMLEEAEHRAFLEVFFGCVRALQAHRAKTGASLQDAPLGDLFAPARRSFAQLSGVEVDGWDRFEHVRRFHTLTGSGPPCVGCGKLLRTPHARSCASCGKPRSS